MREEFKTNHSSPETSSKGSQGQGLRSGTLPQNGNSPSQEWKSGSRTSKPPVTR